MRNRSIAPIALITAVVGTLAFAAPASAVDSDPTPITVNVAGEITINAPTTGPADVTAVPSLDAQAVEFELDQITVTDERGSAAANWTSSVTVAAFSGPSAVNLAAAGTSYVTGAVATTVDFVTTEVPVTSLAEAQTTVLTGAGAGVNITSWSPVVTVMLPTNALAGSYGSTVIHSVL